MITLRESEGVDFQQGWLTFPAGESPEEVGLLFIISLLHPQPYDPFVLPCTSTGAVLTS